MRFLAIFLLLTTINYAQIATGEWRIHSQNRNAKGVAILGTSVYYAFDGAMVEYDSESKEVSSRDVSNGLSDLQLTTVATHESTNSLFIGYQNGNIDQFKGNHIINIPGVKLSGVMGSKRINSIKSHGNRVYFATGFGVVVVDPSKSEIKETYYPGNSAEEIKEVTFKGDSIFALTKTRLYKGALSNPALADPNQWEVDVRLPLITNPNFYYLDLEVFQDSFYYIKKFKNWGSDSLFIVRDSGNDNVIDLQDYAELNGMHLDGDRLVVVGEGLHFRIDFGTHVYLFEQFYDGSTYLSPNAVLSKGVTMYYADGHMGAMRREYNLNAVNVPFNGPGRDAFYSMEYHDGVLAIVPGGLNESGGEMFSAPGVMFFENENWRTYGAESLSQWQNSVWDNLSVSINPTNTNVVAIGGASKTPLSILNRKTGEIIDTFGVYNSTITRTNIASNQSAYVTGVAYDEIGNLWLVNSSTENTIKMLSKDGVWYSFSFSAQASHKTIRKMLLDYNGNIWGVIANNGLAGYSPGTNLTSAADDKTVYLSTSPANGGLPSNNVTAIAMDFDGELWIGTDNGFCILYNSKSVFGAAPGSFSVQRPKISINGETDYILYGTYVNDIEVDGGNRKWMATANSGLLLLSADGMEILKHYTTSNSPLISNNILDVEVNHKNGEVFIITDKGLMSFRGDATYEDATYSDVKIFPNPVRPDHDGLITIQGIRYNSDITITDVDNNVVYKGMSNGGTATWDGRTTTGEKVASGVYLIWTASTINKGRFVGKVVVIN